MVSKVIDVSEWQGVIDWDTVKNNIDGAIIRCSYGVKKKDTYFDRNVSECIRLGIPFGVYLYGLADSAAKAVEEAKYALSLLGGCPLVYPVYYDVEEPSLTSVVSATCEAFCSKIESAGYKAGVYSSLSWWRSYLKSVTRYSRWVAYWGKNDGTMPNKPDISGMDIWQYGARTIEGIKGMCDMDIAYRDFTTNGGNNMSDRERLVNQARSWLGCKESDGSHKKIIDVYNSHKPLARGYKLRYTDAWCAGFVSACAIASGLTSIIPTEVSCPRMIELFKKAGTWVESDSYVPSPGDVVMYDWQDSGSGDNVGTADHVGIVEKVENGVITVIEGNMDNAVGRRSIKVNGKYIRGFGVPKFASASTPTPAKTLDEVVDEVINGKWGHGTTRRERLAAAGYDPDVVQAYVNKKLLGYAKYTPKAGETLSSVAKKFATTPESIAKLNPELSLSGIKVRIL